MYQKILVPIALDHGPHTAAALQVAQLLRDQGGTVIALHVVEALSPYVAQYLPADQPERLRETALHELKSELSDAPDIIADVVTGHAGRTIMEYAQDQAADCIVIASHRPGLQDYFLGSTAARVVRHAPCAVHVVR